MTDFSFLGEHSHVKQIDTLTVHRFLKE